MKLRPALIVLPLSACLFLWATSCAATVQDEEADASPYAAAPDPNAGPPSDLEERLPWPTDFVPPAVLIADEVRIEGPPGLLEHVATRVDPLHHDVQVRTVPAGLRQEYKARRKDTQVEIRAWLDGLEIAAGRALVVLERVSGDDVEVHAQGDAFWKSLAGEEKRGPQLVLSATAPARP